MDEVKDKINDLRRRVVRGDEVSDQELSEGIVMLQRFRTKQAAPKKAAPKKAAGKKSTKAADKAKAQDLLGDLL